MEINIKKFEEFNKLYNGELVGRFPMDLIGFIEYKSDVYHLGEAESNIEHGEVSSSKDGKKRFTKDGGVWNISNKEFATYEDILSVNLDNYPIEPVDDNMLLDMRKLFDEKAKNFFPVPWHYGTILSRCEIEFSWEALLECSALEPEQFSKILNHFAKQSLAVIEGWARTDGVKLIIIHDDIAATKNVIWSPEFLKKYIFPWYEKMFCKVHEYGKKVLYITDGNYFAVIDDLLKLNPDGLYCESTSISPEFVCEKGGKDRFYLVKTDSRNIDIGTKEDIEREVMMLKKLNHKYPKIFSYSGGGNINPENEAFFKEMYNKHLVY